jgi:hypothetical protein
VAAVDFEGLLSASVDEVDGKEGEEVEEDGETSQK